MTGDEMLIAAKTREGAVSAREQTVTLREEAADLREEAAGLREVTSTLGEEAVRAREDAAGLREETSTLGEEALRAREKAACLREETAMLGEEAVRAREDAAGLREETSTLGQEAVRARERAAGLREETSIVSEDAVRARERAAQAKTELDRLMVEMHEANERLIVCTVRAHAITEDAEQRNHLQNELLATVSHELRTPLNAVLGWARMLGTDHVPPNRAAPAIAAIERNAWALAHSIDNLLDMSRMVAGTLRLATGPVDLVAVALGALDGVRPLAVAKKVRLVLSPDPAIATVRGDAIRLKQVISNLLSNAIEFTPEGGCVSVFIEHSADHVDVRVVDTGEGLNPAFLPHAFESFRQADSSTTRRHGGLGLGLAIVRQLVELHGGTVHAASEGVGLGATFTVRLPIKAGHAPAG